MDRNSGSLGEFGIIDLFRQAADSPGRAWVRAGIGDDCAVLDMGGGTSLLVTTDLLTEDVHFLRSGASPWQLGWKSMAVNISDIAAMGGSPAAAFLGLGITPDLGEKFILEFRDGLMACAAEYRVDLLGGDTVRCRNDLVFGITLLGRAPADQVVTRGRARPGDRLMIGGAVGESAAGLRLLGDETGRTVRSADREHLLKAHLEPRPQVALGRWLAREGMARAMIDVSDGLLQDLGHICRSSGVGADVDPELIPLSEPLRRVADAFDVDPLDWALGGGEDYVLLFTVPDDLEDDLCRACRDELGFSPIPVGEMTTGPAIRVRRNSQWVEAEPAGFTHF
jgi:thiamine-monophosphate kinase